MNRREFLSTTLLALAGARCTPLPELADPLRLASRPGEGGEALVPFPLDFVHAGAAAANPRPLLLLLHGAGGKGARIYERIEGDLTVPGLIVVAPDSRGRTWDIAGELGPDEQLIDTSLRNVFAHYAVDAKRIAVAGFSDGASYALALGLTNGDLFTHVIAFSPGFLAVKSASRTRPRVFIAHGRDDDIIPFAHGGKQIAAELGQSRYDVTFRPFDGGHTVRHEIVAEAMSWWSLPRRRIAAILPPS